MKYVYRTHNALKPLLFKMILAKRVSVSLMAFAVKETLLAKQIRRDSLYQSYRGKFSTELTTQKIVDA
jgi:hypothetical protein